MYLTCFSNTQWTFLFETAAKRAVRYVKRCRTERAQRYGFYETSLGLCVYFKLYSGNK